VEDLLGSLVRSDWEMRVRTSALQQILDVLLGFYRVFFLFVFLFVGLLDVQRLFR